MALGRTSATASSACAAANPCGSRGIRLHSLAGALFEGRSHCPFFWQQLFSAFSAVGNMKNCGQEMHPPHSSVVTMRRESIELESACNTALISEYQRAGGSAPCCI